VSNRTDPPSPAASQPRPFREWLRAWGPALTAGLALATVAGVTGRISYLHIKALTIALHQAPQVAQIMPFGVDGLIVVGSVVLLQPPKDQPWLGWIGIGPGVAASVFANWESGLSSGVKSAVWAAVPAAFFALATFMFERWLKAQFSHLGQAAEDDSDADPADFDMQVGVSTALYRLYGVGGVLLYVGITWSIEQRFEAHKRKKAWWDEVSETRVKWYASRAEAALAEFAAIREEHPKYNKALNFDSSGMGRMFGAPATPDQCPHEVATNIEEAVRLAFLHGRDCLDEAPSQRHLATAFGVNRLRVAELVRPYLTDEPEAASGEVAASA
jgi:hypothetical protein